MRVLHISFQPSPQVGSRPSMWKPEECARFHGGNLPGLPTASTRGSRKVLGSPAAPISTSSGSASTVGRWKRFWWNSSPSGDCERCCRRGLWGCEKKIETCGSATFPSLHHRREARARQREAVTVVFLVVFNRKTTPASRSKEAFATFY